MNITSQTLRNTFAGCAAIFATSLLSSSAFATPVEIPTSLHGTYELTFAYEQNGSPIANGTVLEFVFAPGNYVCVAGAVVGDPVLRNGNAHEAIWSVAGLEIALSSLVSGFNEVNIGATGGSPFYGQFQGSKTSSSTDCPGLVQAPDLTAINTLFELAQEKFPDLFGGSNIVNQEIDGYIYRAYNGGIYLAVRDSRVYILGAGYNDITEIGALAALNEQLAAIEVEIPDGNSTLVVTGKFGISGLFQTNLPAITIDNLPMPSSSDIDDVRDAVIEQYGNNVSGTVSVTLISSSSSSLVFNITFNGTYTGVPGTVLYDLTYTYTAN